jgi:hypothetical protein
MRKHRVRVERKPRVDREALWTSILFVVLVMSAFVANQFYLGCLLSIVLAAWILRIFLKLTALS